MEERRIRLVRPEDRVEPEDQTQGMLREEAYSSDHVWVGTLRTEPGLVTGWHHHGDWLSFIYVTAGRARLEFGPGGRDVEEAGPGDFLVVPLGAIHREGTAEGSGGVEAVILRVGSGPVSVNVDGPEEG